jgi:phosphoribosylaminoimidazole-succinocarboxamide synthase
MSEKPLVSIVMGSDSDLEAMVGAADVLAGYGVTCEVRVLSAHRAPAAVAEYAAGAEERGVRLIIAGAGMAAHLAGAVAANTALPVIGVPLESGRSGVAGLDALLSTVQMPNGVPVATVGIGGAKNAGHLAWGMADSPPEFRPTVRRWRPRCWGRTPTSWRWGWRRIWPSGGVLPERRAAPPRGMLGAMSAHSPTEAIPLVTVDLPIGPKHQGKVRDWWELDGQLLIVTTDRQSAFDVVLGAIPGKGQVLNQLSAWWFERTADLVDNHLLAVPDPNVSIVRRARVWPVEMVIRGYITGVTSTALWTSYERGERELYGLTFPDGLRKNERLADPVITPTTKAGAGAHDERLTRETILREGLVPQDVYARMEAATRALFARGSQMALAAGLILVDTKYEFGEIDGRLVVVDEVHTPDSSRFWRAESYEQRLANGQEPEGYDKEFLRRWYVDHGYRGDGPPPLMPAEVAQRMSGLYIDVYEKITGQRFVPPPPGEDPVKRIRGNLAKAGII